MRPIDPYEQDLEGCMVTVWILAPLPGAVTIGKNPPRRVVQACTGKVLLHIADGLYVQRDPLLSAVRDFVTWAEVVNIKGCPEAVASPGSQAGAGNIED